MMLIGIIPPVQAARSFVEEAPLPAEQKKLIPHGN